MQQQWLQETSTVCDKSKFMEKLEICSENLNKIRASMQGADAAGQQNGTILPELAQIEQKLSQILLEQAKMMGQKQNEEKSFVNTMVATTNGITDYKEASKTYLSECLVQDWIKKQQQSLQASKNAQSDLQRSIKSFLSKQSKGVASQAANLAQSSPIELHHDVAKCNSYYPFKTMAKQV